jgi:hypothetical protein
MNAELRCQGAAISESLTNGIVVFNRLLNTAADVQMTSMVVKRYNNTCLLGAFNVGLETRFVLVSDSEIAAP